MKRNCIALLIVSLLSVSLACADEWDREKTDLTQSCSDLFSSFSQIGKCGEFLFTGDPVHLAVPESVVPGGGVALGAVYEQPLPITNWAGSNFTLQGGSSLSEFWFGDAVVTLSHKRWGGRLKPGDRFQVQVYSHARGLPQMPFYGIGPNTIRPNLAYFRERDLSAGASVINPLSSWLDAGGVVEYLNPEITGAHGTSIRSISTYYSNATAPGLSQQPSFGHYVVSLSPKYHLTWTKFNSQMAFHEYQDLDGSGYSFHKFRADFLQTIYPEWKREPTGGVKGQYRRQPNYESVLYIAGRFSAAAAAKNNVVPFYLQETLGGSDIDNIPTLRGFQDYRFRGPDLFSIQAQYERRLLPSLPPGSPRPSTVRSVAGALGIMAFYDAGEVATKLDNLGSSNIRHSFGFGLTIWSAEKVWFRAYIGLGSGEGTHTFTGVTNPAMQNLHL
ncbi:MAG TPA: hypothetical protein VMF91_05925 [Bryobacteraceae bacterium]|nr:hypothetical protein [Bryobacteraceae bacterium]